MASCFYRRSQSNTTSPWSSPSLLPGREPLPTNSGVCKHQKNRSPPPAAGWWLCGVQENNTNLIAKPFCWGGWWLMRRSRAAVESTELQKRAKHQSSHCVCVCMGGKFSNKGEVVSREICRHHHLFTVCWLRGQDMKNATATCVQSLCKEANEYNLSRSLSDWRCTATERY